MALNMRRVANGNIDGSWLKLIVRLDLTLQPLRVGGSIVDQSSHLRCSSKMYSSKASFDLFGYRQIPQTDSCGWEFRTCDSFTLQVFCLPFFSWAFQHRPTWPGWWLSEGRCWHLSQGLNQLEASSGTIHPITLLCRFMVPCRTVIIFGIIWFQRARLFPSYLLSRFQYVSDYRA